MSQTTQKILICTPDYFGVDYVINPWMEQGVGRSDKPLVQQQWNNLKRSLEAQCDLAFVMPQKGLPDMVFTANAGFVLGKKVVVSRFKSKERQGEESFFRHWFENNGFEILPWPEDIAFEGAGDALIDRGQDHVWVAHGFRSDIGAAAQLQKLYNRRTVALKLADPRFYHLDTCLCPLTGGYVMYFPPAFDDESQKLIAEIVPENKRIVVSEDDALLFSCNAVDLNNHVFMNGASAKLQHQLQLCGFTPVIVGLGEFMKSGGAAKCLTLKLVEI